MFMCGTNNRSATLLLLATATVVHHSMQGRIVNEALYPFCSGLVFHNYMATRSLLATPTNLNERRKINTPWCIRLFKMRTWQNINLIHRSNHFYLKKISVEIWCSFFIYLHSDGYCHSYGVVEHSARLIICFFCKL